MNFIKIWGASFVLILIAFLALFVIIMGSVRIIEFLSIEFGESGQYIGAVVISSFIMSFFVSLGNGNE